MFTTKRKPVTLFSSSDAGAPALENTSGCLKNLLNACLVTGYGDKTPLGWEMLFAESASAVFRSKAADSNRYYLQVLNNNAKYGEMAVYSAMTGLNEGERAMFYNNNFHRFHYIGYQDRIPEWRLIGHDKAFILILTNKVENYSGMLFFGDFPSLAAADTGNTLFLHNLKNYDYFSPQPLDSSRDDGNVGVVPKRFNGVVQQVDTSFSSLCYAYRGVPYPDPVNQGLTASEIYLEERLEKSNSSTYATRGMLPGVYKVKQDLSSFKEGAVFDVQGSSDKWLKFNFSSVSSGNYHYLVNATGWES